jgi:proteasome lid subunit RPN8/RPN11
LRGLDSPKIFFRFCNVQLEENLKNYLLNSTSREIFVACLGLIAGRKEKGIVYEIHRMLPFPNMSKTPKTTLIPPENWETILAETVKLERLRFLGFIHSHIDAISKKSRADTNYALVLSQNHGAILMGIIGKGLSFRMYHVKDQQFNLIAGELSYFKLRMK